MAAVSVAAVAAAQDGKGGVGAGAGMGEGGGGGGGEGRRSSTGSRLGAMLRRGTPSLHNFRTYRWLVDSISVVFRNLFGADRIFCARVRVLFCLLGVGWKQIGLKLGCFFGLNGFAILFVVLRAAGGFEYTPSRVCWLCEGCCIAAWVVFVLG